MTDCWQNAYTKANTDPYIATNADTNAATTNADTFTYGNGDRLY